uniref:Nucleoside phosphorylase domain-containing protein n=1 Tax=Trichuris muris TaxID=70415 RepID=A0A5S6QK10_TRIMR
MKEKSDYIVLTPVGYKDELVGVRLERMQLSCPSDVSDVIHSGQGIHGGIIVRSAQSPDEFGLEAAKHEEKPFRVQLKITLHNGLQSVRQKEIRQLSFTFVDNFDNAKKYNYVENFIELLLSNFPSDYGNFLIRLAKLLKRRFTQIQSVDMEIQVTDSEKTILEDDSVINDPADVPRVPAEPPKIGDVQELLEHAFPNGMTTVEIASTLNSSCAIVEEFLSQLAVRGVITHLESDQWVRIDKDADFQNAIGKQMPKVSRSDRPSVAIVTALYAEKLAVDAMLENKRTYVRYKSDGESNVYTLGNIGNCRVVSTKLSAVGQSRSEKISAGSITTRLLGGFPEIEHVFVVGVGGMAAGVSVGDRTIHLGDVVVSTPTSSQHPYAYIICDSLQRNRDSNQVECYGVKTWVQYDDLITRIANEIRSVPADSGIHWSDFSSECLKAIHDTAKDTEFSFSRPLPNVDAQSSAIAPPVTPEKSTLHLGPIAASKIIFKYQILKDDFTKRFGLVAFDAGFDTVVESVFGNRIGSWALIRGISDTSDGTKGKEWQPYAALQAAAVMKAIILKLP